VLKLLFLIIFYYIYNIILEPLYQIFALDQKTSTYNSEIMVSIKSQNDLYLRETKTNIYFDAIERN
jgi:hypothetical protein